MVSEKKEFMFGVQKLVVVCLVSTTFEIIIKKKFISFQLNVYKKGQIYISAHFQCSQIRTTLRRKYVPFKSTIFRDLMQTDQYPRECVSMCFNRMRSKYITKFDYYQYISIIIITNPLFLRSHFKSDSMLYLRNQLELTSLVAGVFV